LTFKKQGSDSEKMTSSKPAYIYKLVPSTAPVPDDLPERLPVSDLDQRSGFIHLSTAPQVPNTLKFFFKDEPHVYVLRIDYERVEKDIRWESPDASVCGPRGGEGMFPVGLYPMKPLALVPNLSNEGTPASL
jgi:uncharacterized protein (DUF952 family)